MGTFTVYAFSEEEKDRRYTEQFFRIIDIFKKKLLDNEAVTAASKLEEISRAMDAQINIIFSYEIVQKKYQLDKYDEEGIESKIGYSYAYHRLKSGLQMLRDMTENILLECFSRWNRPTIDLEELFKWYGGDYHYNTWRLEELERSQSLFVTDPTKVVIKKVNFG